VTPGTIIHTSVDVRGALLAPYADQRRVYDTLTHDGRPCGSVDEYRAALADLLAQGVQRLPIGDPCEGFSHETGCPGHPKEACDA